MSTAKKTYDDRDDRANEIADKYMREWCYPDPHDMSLKAHLINMAHQALTEGEAKGRVTVKAERKKASEEVHSEA
jgi:hypothetical protein